MPNLEISSISSSLSVTIYYRINYLLATICNHRLCEICRETAKHVSMIGSLHTFCDAKFYWCFPHSLKMWSLLVKKLPAWQVIERLFPCCILWGVCVFWGKYWYIRFLFLSQEEKREIYILHLVVIDLVCNKEFAAKQTERVSPCSFSLFHFTSFPCWTILIIDLSATFQRELIVMWWSP